MRGLHITTLSYDRDYVNNFHSPGSEPWIAGYLKDIGHLERFLDLGCGLGMGALLLRSYLDCCDYLVGLDISAHKVLMARTLGLYDDLVVADACRLPFQDSAFDASISMEVLHETSIEALNSLEAVVSHHIVLTLPYLPKETTIKEVTSRGYRVFRSLLRGFVLVDLTSYKVLSAASADATHFCLFKRFLTVLMPALKYRRALEKGHLLVIR